MIKKTYIYTLLLVATIVSLLFFSEEKFYFPKWTMLFFISLLSFAAADQSVEAWKRKGSLILSDLGIGKGGGTGFNPSGDIKMAHSYNDKPSFCVIATGGFNYAGLSLQGHENFIVCPPEHVLLFSGHLVVKTHLRNVKYRQLPTYVQDELKKLPRFKSDISIRKNNIWFGMTSSYYGTDTQDNLIMEERFLEKMSLSDERSSMLKDLLHEKSIFERLKKGSSQEKYKVLEGWKDEE